MDVYNKDVANNSLYSLVENEVIDEVKAILSGGTISPIFIDVIINDELIFNNSGFTMRIKPTTLTGNRSLTLPDTGGQIVVDGAIQTLTNKTLTDPNVSGDIIFNTGGFTSRIGVPVLTSNKTLIIPDSGGQIITESASQNLTNKRYRANDGTATEPTFSFQNDNNTGMYMSGTDTIGITTGGTLRATIDTTSISPNIPVWCQNGTQSAPVFSFSNSTGTGLFYESKGVILSVSVAGSKRLGIDGTTTEHSNIVRFPVGSAAVPSINFGSISPSANSGIFFRSSGINGIVCFSAGGTERANITTTGLQVIDGTALAPSLSFINEPDCGLFVDGINQLGLSIGGTKRLTMTTTDITSTVNIYAPNGSVSSTAYGFSGANNTGMFRDGSGNCCLSTSGATRMRISSSIVNIPYNAGTTQLAFDRLDGGVSAGTLRVDSANDFILTSSSGGSHIRLNPSSVGQVITDRYFTSALGYTGLTGTFRACSIRNDGIIAYDSSSVKYKGEIRNYDKSLDDLMKIEPKCYKITKNKIVVMEKVRGVERAKITLEDIPEEKRGGESLGLLAEDLHTAGLNEYVDYDDDGEPDGVRYNQLVLLCINSIKELAHKMRTHLI